MLLCAFYCWWKRKQMLQGTWNGSWRSGYFKTTVTNGGKTSGINHGNFIIIIIFHSTFVAYLLFLMTVFPQLFLIDALGVDWDQCVIVLTNKVWLITKTFLNVGPSVHRVHVVSLNFWGSTSRVWGSTSPQTPPQNERTPKYTKPLITPLWL